MSRGKLCLSLHKPGKGFTVQKLGSLTETAVTTGVGCGGASGYIKVEASYIFLSSIRVTFVVQKNNSTSEVS